METELRVLGRLVVGELRIGKRSIQTLLRRLSFHQPLVMVRIAKDKTKNSSVPKKQKNGLNRRSLDAFLSDSVFLRRCNSLKDRPVQSHSFRILFAKARPWQLFAETNRTLR